MTLGDVGRKKYFIGVLFHFGQKMILVLWSMTFQTCLTLYIIVNTKYYVIDVLEQDVNISNIRIL